ncbi:hypothetical protein X738_23220 [Mesorhizobium sp. LNHC209A00]|nr:hypothetical protein X738_23220 [Mesorhizobium sp. LNHC209A00]
MPIPPLGTNFNLTLVIAAVSTVLTLVSLVLMSTIEVARQRSGQGRLA